MSTPSHVRARRDLHAWREDQPENFFLADHQIQRLARRLLGPQGYATHAPLLTSFGAVAAGPLDRAAIVNNLDRNLPVLDRWSPDGERTEGIAHHPAYHACGRAIYEDGRLIAVYADPPANTLALLLFLLSSHAGEAGHNCPVACTAGLVRALMAQGSAELRARYLPGLLATRYEDRLDGAQFLTEVQGGSDVGANSVVARPDGEALGTTRWRLRGEKWFCSNADADLILMTARVDTGDPATARAGTKGLGLFLVPRVLPDGGLNHYAVRRLKDKLGTRSMPSGEIDFEGAVGYAIGDVADGFHHVMRYVIHTSRLYNTVGTAGIAARALTVARGYARARRAFGHAIADYPLVADMLADLTATSAALVAGGLELAHQLDRWEAGDLAGDPDQGAFVRVGTNLAKLASCQHSHRAVLTAIETLGGNGAIETFSVLPRLLRDNVVYENWEGTHNVLVAQTWRDFRVRGLHRGFLQGLDRLLALHDPRLLDALQPARAAVQRAKDALPGILAAADPGLGALTLRPHAEALADALFAAALARDVASEEDPAVRQRDTAVLAWFCDRHLAPAPPHKDAAWAAQARLVAGLDGDS